MGKVVKWAIILVASVLGIVLAAVIALYVVTGAQLNKTYDFPVEKITVPTDQASIAHGEHMVQDIYLCTQCHGENLAGQVIVDEPLNGRIAPTNMTTGKGGLGESYTDEDWVRAIRHGVKRDGKAGIFMSSQLFYVLSDSDLGDMIAYIKSVPPVDNVLPKTSLGPMGRFFLYQQPGFILPAMEIDHTAPHPPAPEPGETAEYGKYLARICTTCHNEDYGGRVPQGEPKGDEKFPPNLTPSGDLASWTMDGFVQTIRTGVTPTGRQLDPKAMPWQSFRKMSDVELKAIWLFLQSLPPVQHGTPVAP